MRRHPPHPRDPPRRWTPGRFAGWLGLVTLGGLVLRVAYVLSVRNDLVGGDGWAYHFGSIFLVEGRGFVKGGPWMGFGTHPSAHHPPLWTLLLAIPPLLGYRSWLDHQLFACLVGTATVALVGIAGRRIAGAPSGLLAALLAALYPGLWVYERQVLAETLALLLVATLLYLAYRFLDRPAAHGAAALGAICGLLALTRPEQVVLGLVLVAPLVLLSGATWRRRVAWLALAGATTLALILPWTLYNLPRFERPVLLTTSLGHAMAAGACDATFSGPRLGSYHSNCASRQLLPLADPSVMNAHLVRTSLGYLRSRLDRLPIVVLAREGRAWSLFRPFQQASLDDRWRRSRPWVGRLALFSYWLLLPAAVSGAVALRRSGIPLYPLLAFVWTTALAVAITFGETRYRACAEVSIVLLAGIGLDAALRSRPPIYNLSSPRKNSIPP